MKKLTTFVLRRVDAMPAPAISPGHLAEQGPRETPSSSIRLERLATNEGERDDLRSEADVISVALSVPFKPVDADVAADNRADRNSRGIDAAGDHAFEPRTAEGVRVAILDTGIDRDHPAFDGIEPITENFTDAVPEDVDGHGTASASVVFGKPVEGCEIGIARGVREPLIGKVVSKDHGDTKSVLNGLRWALRNSAHVVMISLKIDVSAFGRYLALHEIQEALAKTYARQAWTDNIRLFDRYVSFGARSGQVRPLILVTADRSHDTRGGTHLARVADNACLNSTLTVGALDPHGTPTRQSDPNADLFAPGVRMLAAQNNVGLIRMSGTGMAAAHSTGTAVIHANRLLYDGIFTFENLRSTLLRLTQPMFGTRTCAPLDSGDAKGRK